MCVCRTVESLLLCFGMFTLLSFSKAVWLLTFSFSGIMIASSFFCAHEKQLSA